MLAELGEVTGMQQSMTDAKSEKNDRVDTMNSVKSDRSAERGPSQQFGNRMGRIEEQLAAMDRKQAFEKESHTVWKKEIDDMVKKSMTETRDNSLQLEMTTKQCKTQEEKLLRNESRVVAAESNIEKLQKAIDKCESDGRDLVLNLKELTSQVELEKNEHKKTVASVDNAHADVGSTSEEIKLMSKDISDIQGALSKIAMRLELAHEYVQGLGKGFQDTHKRVTAGLDGMVAPKTVSNRKMLPEIPGKLRSEVSSPSPAPPSVGPQ
jgi:chromosome segregation ATPase